MLKPMKTVSQIAAQLGRLGGLANKKNHPPDYFKKIGSLGGKKKWSRVKGSIPDPNKK